MKKGTELRTRYRLIDKLTGKDLTNILNDVTATVSYNGKVTDYEDSFVLATGKKEVALSVKVNISGSSYTLYNSWLCDVDENPNYFRVETQTTNGYGGELEKVKLDYTIYYDDQKVSKADIDGSSAKLSWQLLGITNPNGQEVTPDSVSINSDGTISVIYTAKVGEYGTYVTKLKVVCLENRRSRTNTQSIKYYPTDL